MHGATPHRSLDVPVHFLRPALLLVAIALCSLPHAVLAEEGIRLPGGMRIISVTPGTQPAPPAPSLAREFRTPTGVPALTNEPPLEGPQTSVVFTVTDERADEFDFFATAHAGVDGNPLPGATTNQALAILDSGGGGHLVSYPDAAALGLQGAFLSGATLEVGGVVGSITLDLSIPVGFFAHGVQDMSAGGDLVPSLTFGQGNFSALVNSAGNHAVGDTISTILGAPFFAYFATYVQHSQRVDATVMGQAVSTPAVTFYPSPTDAQIPVLDKRILIEIRPGSSGLTVFYFPSPLFLPSLLSGDSSLFFTANDVTLSESTNSVAGRMVVDTGAQATLISVAAATALGLNLAAPDFEVEVKGIGSATLTAPGFYIDELSVPAIINQSSEPTDEVWNNVPVVVLNIGSPEGGTLFGIFGMNLLDNRDYVFNGALPVGPSENPYLDITNPFIPPVVTPSMSPLGYLVLAALLVAAGAAVRHRRQEP